MPPACLVVQCDPLKIGRRIIDRLVQCHHDQPLLHVKRHTLHFWPSRVDNHSICSVQGTRLQRVVRRVIDERGLQTNIAVTTTCSTAQAFDSSESFSAFISVLEKRNTMVRPLLEFELPPVMFNDTVSASIA